MKYRYLEDFRDKHKGEEVWVLGRGPSLDDYPPNFFEDKISIAVMYAYVAFRTVRTTLVSMLSPQSG